MTKIKTIWNIGFVILLIAFLIYAANYILSTSFVINGQRYFVLFDDAMISMRFARNMAQGFGLVWNPGGERIEGFTNPLWVIFMAFFHLFPIPETQISLYIQVSGALFLAINLFFVKKITEEFTSNPLVILLACLLVAFYGPLNIWSLLGMEVSLLVMVASIAVYGVLKTSPERFPYGIYLLLGISTFVRMDMTVIYLAILAVLFFAQPNFRKRHLLLGIGLLILFLGTQTLLRYWYYGAWLPNTYYLKVEGFPVVIRILRGLYVLFMLTWRANWILCLLPLSLLFFRRDWKIGLLFLVFAGQVAYSVYVGGDAWEHHGGANRYISTAIPLFFILFALSVERITTAFFQTLTNPPRWASFAVQTSMVIFTILSMLNFNAVLSDWKSIERWTLARRPAFVAGNDHYINSMLAIRKIVAPSARIAVTAAGTVPYFLGDQYVIDMLGKVDPVVAHGPLSVGVSIAGIPDLQPGHMKWNYAYSIGQLKPDLIVTLRGETGDEAAPYLVDYMGISTEEGISFYVLKDSPHIRWENIPSKN